VIGRRRRWAEEGAQEETAHGDRDWLRRWEAHARAVETLLYEQWILEQFATSNDNELLADVRRRLDEARADADVILAALRDPTQRDQHLADLDFILLCRLEAPRSLVDLEARASRFVGYEQLITHTRANAVCPIIWRWLRDAERRRYVRQATQPATAHTTWSRTWRGAFNAWGMCDSGWPDAEPHRDTSLEEFLTKLTVEREAVLQAAAATLPEPPAPFLPPPGWNPPPRGAPASG
jgi:hypothetical protein